MLSTTVEEYVVNTGDHQCFYLAAGLTSKVVQSGHWMAQEKPAEVNAALAHWLATSLTDVWPK